MLKCIPSRLVLAFLCATGLMEIYMTRTNLSIAIVEMVQIVNADTALNATARQPYCLLHQNTSILSTMDANDLNNKDHIPEDLKVKRIPPIQVTTTQRGYILSAFFYTYGFTGILGGRLAEKYGTKKVMGIAVFVDVLGNLLIPVASKSSYILLILIRSVLGFSQGMVYPAVYSLLTKWIPKPEFSRFVSAVLLANSFGSIFTLQVGGYIVNDYGYEMAFYVCGLIGLIWLLFWVLFMHETPDNHPSINDKEKIYILENRPKSGDGKKSVPWLKLFSSIPVLAQCIAHAGNMFGLGFMITQLPLYLSSIIGFNIKKNGLLSSLPFLARFIGANSISWATNYLMGRSKWTKKTWFRICTVIGHWCTGLCILLVGYVGCNPTAALVLFSLAMFLNGATSSGYNTNHFLIAPNFSGTLQGTANLVAFLYTTCGPIIVGALTPEETLGEWITVYWVIFVSYFVCGLFFMIFLSTEAQPWSLNTVKPLEKDVNDAQEMETLQTLQKV